MPLMFDSVNPSAFPASGFDATAGYVDGLFKNSDAIKARFPNLPHVTIAVFARDDAMCLDVEPGDATPAEAPAWLDRQYARGNALPILYCNTSQIGAVRAAVGSRPFLWWSASYTYVPHLDPGADATQFADKGPNGENVDQTLMSPTFLSAITPHAPASQEDDEMKLYIFRHQNGAACLATPKGAQPLDGTVFTQLQAGGVELRYNNLTEAAYSAIVKAVGGYVA